MNEDVYARNNNQCYIHIYKRCKASDETILDITFMEKIRS